MEWWEFFIAMAIFLPIMVLWLGCIIDAIGRPDLSGLMKAAWIGFILILPIVGAITYVIARPRVVLAKQAYEDMWENVPTPTADRRDQINRDQMI
jgi:hypothetical protein